MMSARRLLLKSRIIRSHVAIQPVRFQACLADTRCAVDLLSPGAATVPWSLHGTVFSPRATGYCVARSPIGSLELLEKQGHHEKITMKITQVAPLESVPPKYTVVPSGLYRTLRKSWSSGVTLLHCSLVATH